MWKGFVNEPFSSGTLSGSFSRFVSPRGTHIFGLSSGKPTCEVRVAKEARSSGCGEELRQHFNLQIRWDIGNYIRKSHVLSNGDYSHPYIPV
jgi:hypothetical protein